MKSLTPMMQQYLEIKEAYRDALLFFRLGDFYEMFNEDALIAARVLEIALTSREAGKDCRIPMCGIPYHAVDTYLPKLLAKGYKVAICEQVEDPRVAKGIVKREVVRVISPGTVVETNLLDEKRSNYLVVVVGLPSGFGLAYTDISTGEFGLTQFTGHKANNFLRDELSRLNPAECLVNPGLLDDEEMKEMLQGVSCSVFPLKPEHEFSFEQAVRALERKFSPAKIKQWDVKEFPLGTVAAASLLESVKETQKKDLDHIRQLRVYRTQEYMFLDSATRRNLEITSTIRTGSRDLSLLGVIDRTVTSMGGRLLNKWLQQPLLDRELIEQRLDAVDELVGNYLMRSDVRDILKQVYDLERLAGRISFGNANARDLVALRTSLEKMPGMAEVLRTVNSPGLQELASRLDLLQDVTELIGTAITDEPALALTEGGIIKEGYHYELDRLREAAVKGKEWIANLEAEEREKTGIKSLKIGFNKVFGYYIEVTRANLHAVPDYYQRKQTLANGERYLIPKLKEYEDLILGSQEKSANLEYDLFLQVRSHVGQHIDRLQQTAGVLAELDVLAALAEVAAQNGYVRPRITSDNKIRIKGGRHPVVEHVLTNERFVPNDTYLNNNTQRLAIITGPNMAGKSTYLRQVALIVLLAQAGSFVPAEEAEIGICDRIFARVGASDDLASGQSTFMVEMTEVANIIHHATDKSLVLLDEVGRGTSTYDGLSLAWAISEYLHDHIKAKTLFATHYHELTELESLLPGVKNYSVAVKEQGDEVVFLRQIIPGGADRSYGIYVAKLAGLPEQLLKKAAEILTSLENQHHQTMAKNQISWDFSTAAEVAAGLTEQSEEKDDHPVLAEIRNLNLLTMTPLAALNKLFELQESLER